MLLARGGHVSAQLRIGRDAAADLHVRKPFSARSVPRLADQYFNDSVLKTGTQIRQRGVTVWVPGAAHMVEHSRFEPAKREVIAGLSGGHRPRQRHRRASPAGRESIDNNPTRVSEPQQLRHFVERFSGRVIARRAKFAVHTVRLDVHE